MPRYQLRFCDKAGHGSFTYFDAETNIENEAANKADEYIKKYLKHDADSHNIFRILNPYKPKRVVDVWEMDMATKQPKEGGHRFKLQLPSVKATLEDGSKIGNQFYLPIKEQ